MPDALEAGEVGDQELASPQRAVEPVAETVEGHADRRPLHAVVGQAGGDVRVVVLDGDPLDAVQLERVLGRQVLRMEVVRDDLGGDVEQPAEVRDALGEGAQGLEILQVADVLREKGVAPAHQAEGVLQLAAARQDGPRRRPRQEQRLRRVAAGAPDQRFRGRASRVPPSRPCGRGSAGRGSGRSPRSLPGE